MLRKQQKNINANSRILGLPIAILFIDIFNECKVQNVCLVKVQSRPNPGQLMPKFLFWLILCLILIGVYDVLL